MVSEGKSKKKYEYLRREEHGSIDLKGNVSTYIKKTFAFVVLVFLGLSGSAQLVINEFSAANATVIEDTDFSDFADWIEIYNAGSIEQDLNGYYITDDLATPNKWRINGESLISPGGFLLIWTDGRDTGLHASFKLSSIGEEIGLFSPSLVLLDSLSFSEQKTDVSYGRISDGNTPWVYFDQPTPSASNSTPSYIDYTSLVPKFSVRGGFYNSSFFVELSSDQGGVIRYSPARWCPSTRGSSAP